MISPGVEHRVSYFKRFRMEIDLLDPLPEPSLPAGYSWVPWCESLLETHADVKFCSFLDEVDTLVFPSLGSRLGCLYLMREIARKPGFHPQATWLITSPDGHCGTVQGVRERYGLGAIQNLGVTPQNRGRGLGGALLLKALHGFRQWGLQRAFLEVTAQNDGAIRLYRRLGFRCRKTIYKAVESGLAFTDALPVESSATWLAQGI
jgi:ribosomal protein S18 acetylase RimI-like enzyme